MQFDALSTACMAAELQTTLAGGRVQGLLLVDETSLGLEVYARGARRQLLLAAPANGARVHLVEHKLRRGPASEPPLLLLARKYVRDAQLSAVTQPNPYERVLHLAFHHPQHGPTTLVAELIGRRPNLLLLAADGRILAVLHPQGPRREGDGKNDSKAGAGNAGAGKTGGANKAAGGAGERVLLPGHPYAPPPVQPKLPPLDDRRPDYYEQLAAVLAAPGKLAKVLVAAVDGLSPAAAREVAWRATGDAEAPAAASNVLALAAALQSLWGPLASGEWQPGVVVAGGLVVGFAPYVAHTGGVFTPTATLSAAVAACYAAPAGQGSAGQGAAGQPPDADAPTRPPATADPYAAPRAAVAAALERARRAVARRLAALAGDEPAPGAAERLRTQAEWLLALSTQVTPGAAYLEVPLEGETLRIELDPALGPPPLGPVAQAQRLFHRAGKLDRAAVFIPQRRAELEQDLALLDQLALDLGRAANQPEIAAVGRDLAAAGLVPVAARKGGAAGPGARPGDKTASTTGAGAGSGGGGPLLRVRSPQGLEIVVGRNARQNERVTFGEAKPEDLWLHARGVPGAHVVIRSGGQAPDGATIRLAAQWAAYHSGARGDRVVEVTVTRRRWITRAPGGKLGQVLVKQEEQVVAVPGVQPAGG